MNLEELQKRFKEIMKRLKEIRDLKADALTDEIRTERDGLLTEIKTVKSDIDAIIQQRDLEDLMDNDDDIEDRAQITVRIIQFIGVPMQQLSANKWLTLRL